MGTAGRENRPCAISNPIYSDCVNDDDHDAASDDPPLVMKPVVWLHASIKSPPFTAAGRMEAGRMLALVQVGENIPMPISRPMPSVGPRCHELRVRDERHNWRIVYRIDTDAIVAAEVFPKTTQKTPPKVIALCKARLAKYDRDRTGS